MPISDTTIQEIKNRVDIIDVVGDFVSLKKVGSNYRALSPFTNEKTPSFYVSPSKEIFKCFSSGKGGDAISFLMELEGINYVEALKYLAEKYGIEIEEEEQTDEQIQAQNERESLFIVLNFANEFFKSNLLEHDEGRSIGLSYFKERGLIEQTISTFGLGYALDQWDGLLNAAKEKGFTEDMLEKAGLILKSDNKTYDRFRGRVTFPIHNVAGKVIAFGARMLGKDKNQPKYINSPETAVYHKSNVLYGIHQARKAIRDADRCFLVEGYTDVTSLHQAGIQNVVASSGTSLTKEQVQLIARFTQNITILYDGDAAGIKASFRGIDIILEQDLNVQALVLPNGEDPDSFAQSVSHEELLSYLTEQAKDFIQFKLEVLTEGERNPTPDKKVATIKEIIQSIALMPDGIKRSVYINNSSELLEVDEQVLISELNKILIQKQSQQRTKERFKTDEAEYLPVAEKQAQPQEEPKIGSTEWEKECLRLAINYGNEPFNSELNLASFLCEELDGIPLEDERIRYAFDEIRKLLEDQKPISPDHFIGPERSDLSPLVIDLLEMKYFVSDVWKQKHKILTTHESEKLPAEVQNAILRLKRKKLEMLLLENEEALKKAESVDEVEEFQHMHIHLKGLLGEINQALGTVISS